MILYSASWCPACKVLKKQLDDRGIDYETRMLDDEKYMREASDNGIHSIPAVVNGEVILVNPSIDMIEGILKEQGL